MKSQTKHKPGHTVCSSSQKANFKVMSPKIEDSDSLGQKRPPEKSLMVSRLFHQSGKALTESKDSWVVLVSGIHFRFAGSVVSVSITQVEVCGPSVLPDF